MFETQKVRRHEKDKSSDIEHKSPFSDRKYNNTLLQKRWEIQNQGEHHIYNVDKV